jgi:hypothetical protein
MAHAQYRWIRAGDHHLPPKVDPTDLLDLHPRASQLYLHLRAYAADPTRLQPTAHFLRDGIMRAHTKTLQAAFADLAERTLIRRVHVHGRYLILVNPLPSEVTFVQPLAVEDLTEPVAAPAPRPLTAAVVGVSELSTENVQERGDPSPVGYYSQGPILELLRSSHMGPLFVISAVADEAGRMTAGGRERLAAYHGEPPPISASAGPSGERSEPSPTESPRQRAERLRAALPRTGSGIKKVRNRKRGPKPTPINPDVEIVIGLYRHAYLKRFGLSPEEHHPHVWGNKNARGIDKKNIERLTQHYTIPALLAGIDLFLSTLTAQDFVQIRNWGHTLRAFYNLWPTLLERHQRDIQRLANERYAEYAPQMGDGE